MLTVSNHGLDSGNLVTTCASDGYNSGSHNMPPNLFIQSHDMSECYDSCVYGRECEHAHVCIPAEMQLLWDTRMPSLITYFM